jgi:hypothetical protein
MNASPFGFANPYAGTGHEMDVAMPKDEMGFIPNSIIQSEALKNYNSNQTQSYNKYMTAAKTARDIRSNTPGTPEYNVAHAPGVAAPVVRDEMEDVKGAYKSYLEQYDPQKLYEMNSRLAYHSETDPESLDAQKDRYTFDLQALNFAGDASDSNVKMQQAILLEGHKDKYNQFNTFAQAMTEAQNGYAQAVADINNSFSKNANGEIILADAKDQARYNSLMSSANLWKQKYDESAAQANGLMSDPSFSAALNGYYTSVGEMDQVAELAKNNLKKYPELMADMLKSDREQIAISSMIRTMPGGDVMTNISNPVGRAVTKLVKSASYLPKMNLSIIEAMTGHGGDYDWTDELYDNVKEWNNHFNETYLPVAGTWDPKTGQFKENLLPRLAESIADMAIKVGGAAIGAGALASLSGAAEATSGMLTVMQGAAFGAGAASDYYDAGIAAGMSESQASIYSTFGAAVTGAAMGVNPAGSEAAQIFSTAERNAAVFTKALADGVGTTAAMKTAMKGVVREIYGANVVGFVQKGGDLVLNTAANQITGANLSAGEHIGEDLKETIVMSTLLGGVMGAFAQRNNFRTGTQNRLYSEALFEAASNPKEYRERIMQMKKDGLIDDSRMNFLNEQLDIAQARLSSMPKGFTPAQKREVLATLVKKGRIEAELKTADSSFKPHLEEEIQQIENEIQQQTGVKTEQPEGKEGEQQPLTPEQEHEYDQLRWLEDQGMLSPEETTHLEALKSRIPAEKEVPLSNEGTQGTDQTSSASVRKAGEKTDEERLAESTRNADKREEARQSLIDLRNQGVLVSADKSLLGRARKLVGAEKKVPMSDKEIDVQMKLMDAMSDVWKKTTGNDNFYETFIGDIKKGDLKELQRKGGTLRQEAEGTAPKVTLAIFNDPTIAKMKGQSVNPQQIRDMIKSRGKQIEKDIISEVLDYEKYKGQKRINFDEFRRDVEMQTMRLEPIRTSSYSEYGQGNLGDNENYGDAETIVFNAPIEHGETGHFGGDFTREGLEGRQWEMRQIPGTEMWAAVDKAMPDSTPPTEIERWVGTAGNKDQVQRWVDQRTSPEGGKNINVGLFGHIRSWFNKKSKVFTVAELQSDYFQKNKATDLLAQKVSQHEIDAFVDQKMLDVHKDTYEAITKELGIEVKKNGGEWVAYKDGKRVGQSDVTRGDDHSDAYHDSLNKGQAAVNAAYNMGRVKAMEPFEALESDGPGTGTRSYHGRYQVDVRGYGPIDGDIKVFDTLTEAEHFRDETNASAQKAEAKKEEFRSEYNKRRSEILNVEKNKFIEQRAKEIESSGKKDMMLAQFIASAKGHEGRLMREAVKTAAESGAETMRFPEPYTIAVIEGYVSKAGENGMPYEVVHGDPEVLSPGDVINYGGTEMTVIDTDRGGIRVAPSDDVHIFDYHTGVNEEVNYREETITDEIKREFKDTSAMTREEVENWSADEWLADHAKEAMEDYFRDNEDAETVAWEDIESDVRKKIEDELYSMPIEDLFGGYAEVYMDGDNVITVNSRGGIEEFQQPQDYESSDATSANNFEESLSSGQQTVVDKYKGLNKEFKKMRPDAKRVVDENGMGWLETAITDADRQNPVIAFQESGAKVKGAVDFSAENKATIHLFEGADISTLTHEIGGHIGRRFLERLATGSEEFATHYKNAKEWAGVKGEVWTRKAEEKFARGFERYLRDGKAPNDSLKAVFDSLKEWLTNVYKTIKGSSLDVKMSDEIRQVFDRMLSDKEPAKPEAVKEGATVKPKTDATQEGIKQEGDQLQHQNGDETRQAESSGRRNRDEQSGQEQEEVLSTPSQQEQAIEPVPAATADNADAVKDINDRLSLMASKAGKAQSTFALFSSATRKIREAVKNGLITKETAAKMEAKAKQMKDARVGEQVEAGVTSTIAWMRERNISSGDKDVVKAGLDIEGLVKFAGDVYKRALSKGMDVEQAIEKAIEAIKSTRLWGKVGSDEIENRIREDFKREGMPPKEANVTPEQKVRQVAGLKRMMESDRMSDELKSGLQEEGITYVQTSQLKTETEAAEVVKFAESQGQLDELYNDVVSKDVKFKDPLTRGMVALQLFEHYQMNPSEGSVDKMVKLSQEANRIATTSGATSSIIGKFNKRIAEGTEEGMISYAEAQAKDEAAKRYKANERKNKTVVHKINVEAAKTREAKPVGEAKKAAAASRRTSLFEKFKTLPPDKPSAPKGADVLLQASERVRNTAEILKTYLEEGETANAVTRFRKDYEKAMGEKPSEEMIERALDEVVDNVPLRDIITGERRIKKILSDSFGDMSEKGQRKLVAEVSKHLGESGSITNEQFKEAYTEAMKGDILTDEVIEQMKKDRALTVEAKASENDLRKTIDEWKEARVEAERSGGVLSREKNAAFRKDIADKWNKYKKSMEIAAEGRMRTAKAFIKPDIWVTLASGLRGNLMTPMTTVANVVANIAITPFRFLTRVMPGIVEYVWVKASNAMFGTKLDRSMSPMAEAYGMIKFGWSFSAYKTWRRLITGSAMEGEQFDLRPPGLNFVDSMKGLITGRKPGETRFVERKLSEAYGSSFGVIADIMSRGAAVPDYFGRTMAEIGRAYEIAKTKTVDGKPLSEAEVWEKTMFPDEADMAAITKAGKKAVYMQDNVLSKSIQNLGANKLQEMMDAGGVERHIAGFIKLAKAGVFPFTTVPLNIITEMLHFTVPEFGMASGIYDLIRSRRYEKSDQHELALDARRSAQQNFAKSLFAVGLSYAVGNLVRYGLIQPNASRDEKPGEKAAAYAYTRPGTVNWTAIQRLMSGDKDWYKIEDSDTWCSYQKLGTVGMMMGVWAEIYRHDSQREIETTYPVYDAFMHTMGAATKSAFDQSFLKSESDFLTILANPDRKGSAYWTANYGVTMSKIFLPNVVSQISKGSDDVLRDTRGNTAGEIFLNNMKSSLFMGDQLPSKVTLWGDEVKNAPSGTNPYYYYMMSVMKSSSYDGPNMGRKLFDFYRTTDDDDLRAKIWPKMPSQQISINRNTVQLTPSQYHEYQVLVGKQRAMEVEKYVMYGSFDEDSPEVRAAHLNKIYSAAQARAKKMLIMGDPALLSTLAGVDLTEEPE